MRDNSSIVIVTIEICLELLDGSVNNTRNGYATLLAFLFPMETYYYSSNQDTFIWLRLAKEFSGQI